MKNIFSLPVKWLLLSTLTAGALSLIPDAQASVIAYYRFEDSPGFLNSSVGTLPLGNAGTGTVTQSALPATGPGSDFPSVIPATGDPNLDAASFPGTAVLQRSLDTAINPSTAITIEAFINPSIVTGTRSIVARRSSSGDTRAWGFSIVSGNLSFLVSENGSNSSGLFYNISSSLSISASVDYYVAVTYDSDSGAMTFYSQDLTNSGSLLSASYTGNTLNSINSASNTFLIGGGRDAVPDYSGLIDEVRISNTALSQSELMIIPEPSSAALLGLGVTVFLFLRRRR